MTRLNGSYFDGLKPLAIDSAMDFTAHEATMIAGDLDQRYSISDLKVSPRIGRSDRFIALPNGAQFSCPDNIFLDALPQESPSEGPVAWLEERWGIALASVATMFCLLSVLYFYALPIAAERIAARIPMKLEQSIGNKTLSWLDQQNILRSSELDLALRKRTTEIFALLCSDLPFKNYYRLEFRAVSGSNAFALPGGVIVITDDMVKVAITDEEILAVLAHEIGHQELRHSMRSLFQNSLTTAALASVSADAVSTSYSIGGFSSLVAITKYSRKFESEADEYAFKLLKRRGYSAASFASIMERLYKKNELISDSPNFLSTHPITSERILRARKAATE
jgi:predicted Zn-dependent protease